jgi:hypothetical protein
VRGSHFDIDRILYSVRFVMDASVSMRASSRICDVLAEIDGRPPFEEPCHTTIQNFILRIGLYLVQQRVLQRLDWIWIIDHTIGAGTTKCLVVLGIEQSKYEKLGRPLQHHDLETLALIPVEQSNGVIVHEQLQEVSDRYGVPLAVLSDHGSDLKKGVELLQKDHPALIALYDIVHLVSRLIEKFLQQDQQWDQYRKACCRCANAVRQSKLAHLKPPRPKTKARYMNIDREVRWGARALGVLERVRSGKLSDRQKQRLPLEQIEEKLGWLDEFRSPIECWMELSSLGQRASGVIRHHGYAAGTVEILRRELGQPEGINAERLVCQIIEKVSPMCQAVGADTTLPGSSEVLESLIGKGKRLLGQSNSNSLTRQVLAMATATAELTPDLIRTALSTCRTKDLKQWCIDNLQPGVHCDRREDLQPTTKEENLRNVNLTAIPNF